MKTQSKIRWFYLAMGTLVMLFAGVIYAWTILKAPLAEEFKFTSSALSVNYTLTFCFFCLGGITNGRIRSKAALRWRLLAAGILVLIGFFLASRMTGAAMLYIGYGILGGFGIGMIYNNIVSEMTLWFRDRQGLCSGILMMGFGASAMVLGTLIQSMLDTAGIGWRGTYLILGIAICVVTVLAALIIRPAETLEGVSAGKTGSGEERDYKPGQMVRTFAFWAIFVRAVCVGSAGSVIINFSRELSLSLGATIAMATAAVGILSICNGLGRLITGFLFDLLHYRMTVWLSNGLSLLGLVLVIVSYLQGSAVIFMIAAVVVGLAYGSSTTFASAVTSDFFGKTHFSQNFSVMNITLVVSSLATIGCSMLLDHFGGYLQLFLLLGGMMIVGCIMTLFIVKK